MDGQDEYGGKGKGVFPGMREFWLLGWGYKGFSCIVICMEAIYAALMNTIKECNVV